MRIDNPQFVENYKKLARAYGARESFYQTRWDTTTTDPSRAQSNLLFQNIKFDSRRGLYIYGKPGVGKTHSLKLIFNQVFFQLVADYCERIMWNNYPYWIHASSYLESQRQFEKSDEMEKIKQNALKAKWLFIDDLGATTKTDWAVDQIYQIVDERVQSEKQTFISSNLSPTEIGSFYNERISSRIAELCLPVALDGVDRRVEGMRKDYVETISEIKNIINQGN